MFILQRHFPVNSTPVLNGSVGAHGQLAVDADTGDRWLNLQGTWSKIATGAGLPVSLPLTGSVTVQNSAGTITRSLTAANGLVSLAATDTIVANNDSLVLKKSDGTTTSTGNAGLNSPATAVVAGGVVSNVKASA